MKARIVNLRLKRRTALRAAAALAVAGSLPLSGGPAAAAAGTPRRQPLTNLDHMDFLCDTVTPPEQDGHTTYRLAEEPEFGVIWVYTQHNPDGSYTRVGGGAYDAATDSWGQGAFYPGDAARAAVAYLRHWRIHGDGHSLDRAYQLLRGVAYMQEASGPNLGNFEQWMQPDGRINRESVPFDGNSDRESYANARAIWAFGEAYEVFRNRDPQFARFLQERLVLCFDSLDRQSLYRYGEYHVVDGLRWPSWFLGRYGANSTADLMQGLVAYIRSTDKTQDPATRQVHDRAARMLSRYGEALNELKLGDAFQWPFGAMMNDAAYRAHWAGWGTMMAGSLADAGALLGRRDWIDTAAASVSTSTPHVMIQGGPDNQWSPAPVGRIQFGFSADNLVQSLYKVSVAVRRPGIRALAGYAASWYFGNNYASRAMYNPDNGVLFDGVTGDGYVNTNSGAEVSHALMSMELLDQNPDLAGRALTATPIQRHTWRMVEAEAGQLSGAATVSDPSPFVTGEGQWSGRSVTLHPGGRVDLTVELPAGEEYLILPVVNREQVPKGELGLRVTADGAPLATVDLGGAGDRGVTSRPGYPDVVTIQAPVTVGQNRLALSFAYDGAGDHPITFDAVLIQPLVEVQTVGDSTSAQALLRSFSRQFETRKVSLPTHEPVTARAYDVSGQLVRTVVGHSGTVEALVAPGGYTLVSSRALAPA